jgi:lipopolysaccharide/colanic/teichoic acid biosynthesis glycosyltransferase
MTRTALDRGGAAVLIVVLLPALLLIALSVRLSGRGPVLERRPCTGQDGRAFALLVFRTNGVRLADVGRLLRRTGLDQLPQLLNVFLGQMTFIAPRPGRGAVPGLKPGLVGLPRSPSSEGDGETVDL